MAKIATVATPRLKLPMALQAPIRRAIPVPIRFYSTPAVLTQEQVEGRILDLLKGFDKVSGAQLIHAQCTNVGEQVTDDTKVHSLAKTPYRSINI